MKNLLLSDRNKPAMLAKIIILMLPLTFTGICMDNDFWFIINHGRYLLTYGFTNIEPFTVHADLAFSFEKWLTCIVFYKIYDWFGTWGMYIFIQILFAIIIFLFYKACLLFSRMDENISLVVTAFCMVYLGSAYVRTRPQMFSYIFMIYEIICLEKYARTQDVKKLYPLPVLAFLYMQFHSTMLPIFFIMAMPYVFDFGFVRNILGVRGGLYRKSPILIILAVSAAVTLINPYGYRSFVYLINSLNDSGLLSNINEVKRSSLNDLINCGGPVIGAQFIYLAIRLFKKEKFPLRYLYLLGGTFLMAVYAVRNIAFLTIMGGIVAAFELKSIKTNYRIMPLVKKLAAIGIIICISQSP
ncbi:MAG: hypothetical protein MJ150_05150, partial [Clostridia bacterium]|nr:hypothetical protein [Clostridia bacterium]